MANDVKIFGRVALFPPSWRALNRVKRLITVLVLCREVIPIQPLDSGTLRQDPPLAVFHASDYSWFCSALLMNIDSAGFPYTMSEEDAAKFV
ncbi:hypothetical protein PoB_006813800 [Plakobranchus ocellatus]|uniref:Uncharacterized protein n=1 Tax=Plakobranchus ocellatus TaxID=259542 RepID=A0AAV4DC53_9GAST|nr:hypothetical protein PoB_006813800 [Plakobranchus ocellatus]